MSPSLGPWGYPPVSQSQLQAQMTAQLQQIARSLSLPPSMLAPPAPDPGPAHHNEVQRECTGYDFAVGAARGIRAWQMTPDGGLVGATGWGWGPGEQVAYCLKRGAWPGWREDHAEPRCDDPDHDMAACTCGFYAYHDGVSDGMSGATVLHGVIEGYGKTTIGTRGFRCSKARILALAVPSVSSSPTASPTWGCPCPSCSGVITSQALVQLHANYPKVRLYADAAAMLRDFPLDRGPEEVAS